MIPSIQSSRLRGERKGNRRDSKEDRGDVINDAESQELETYHPRVLVRQARISEQAQDLGQTSSKSQTASDKSQKQQEKPDARQNSKASRWFGSLRRRTQATTDKTAPPFASLDSTRSSSSMEAENGTESTLRASQLAMPLISITSNDATSTTAHHHERSTQDEYNEYYGRPRIGMMTQQRQRRALFGKTAGISDSSKTKSNFETIKQRHRLSSSSTTAAISQDGDQDEDVDNEFDDQFDDPPLPIPYSSSSSALLSSRLGTGVEDSASSTTNYEDLLDDRQGMNNSLQQFTKGESSANKPSIDGSIISDQPHDGAGLGVGMGVRILKKPPPQAGGISSGGLQSSATQLPSSLKRDQSKKQTRSKSPSSMAKGRRAGSRHGFMGLASRLHLTRKHESIASFQLTILNSGCVSLKTVDRDLQTFLPRERLSPKEFEARCKLMRKYEVLSTIEYKFASRYETYVCRHAFHELNLPKNNNKKCIPYDYNRVVLKTLPNVPHSDYINASHIDSCLKPNAYIAAQGPNESTVEDFWRMIWEQKTFVIVMLTKVFDFIKVMCNQYWPVELNKPECYGNIEVTLLYEEPLADFVIRTIRLTRKRRDTGAAGVGDNTPGTAATMASDLATVGSGPVDQTGANSGHGSENNEDNQKADDNSDLDEYFSDETDISENFEDDEQPTSEVQKESGQNKQQKLQVPLVRAPKYVARVSRKACQPLERNSADSELSRVQSHQVRSSSQPPPSPTGNMPADRKSSKASQSSQQQSPKQRRPNEFLHPLFFGPQMSNHLGGSSSSLASAPATPTTPRTPSSAGLDRSSATRRAVKKKRRAARVKNARPVRTKFQVPDESQLVDDDDDELDMNPNARPSGSEHHRGAPTMNNDTGNGDDLEQQRQPSNERIIYQFHYNGWASHTCPFISSLLHFRRRVRICMDEMAKSGKTGPTVVHCNDGCGRTGTYLCIDANLELAEEDSVYDVYNYTKKMRQSRKFLIENLEQYKFVYDTIEEYMYCGRTWFPVSELSKQLKRKSQRNPITRKNEYQREYEKITRMATKFSIGDCAGGHRVENREKNRDVSTVPPDNFRPYITSFQSNDNTDYINAVFVDGYTRSKEYIVTEWPLHKTISDFWSLIYDHDCNSVILLANPGESSTYPSFLPTEKELRRKFGPVFSAEMVSYTHYPNIKSWIYTINKKIVSLTEVIAGVKSEAKTTQVFQITCWPQGHRVPTSTNALVELMNMVERWRQRTAYGPVCVVSLNGKSRAGVYCAANVAIEQVVQHSEVDVFQAVKTVRRHRPQLIENMTEYKYCYDLILHYVLHYVNQNSAYN